MKVPDSGMPEETYWESLFDIPLILDRLKIDRTVEHVAELGCDYGTFTLPVARRIQGVLFTFDIERAMIDRTLARAAAEGVSNINVRLRDVLATGFGLETELCDAVLLLNILAVTTGRAGAGDPLAVGHSHTARTGGGGEAAI